MNICYLIDVHPRHFNGGGQVHLLNLFREVKRSDLAARSDLIIFAGPSPLFFIRLCWMLWVIPQVFFHHLFLRRFDLIHAHSIPAMIPAKALSVLLGIPVVVTVHGHTMGIAQHSVIPRLPARRRGGTRNLYRFLIKSGMTIKIILEKFVLTNIRYDAEISVSRDFLQYQNVNKNIFFIPNGVNLSSFKGPSLRPQGRSFSSSTINHQPLTILFVGRKNDQVKGFSVLEKAMELVKRKIPGVRFIIADGSVLPFRLPHLYHSSNLLVIPSLSEGFPLTLLEAWASHLPVVATAVGEIPYLFGMSARSLRNFQSGKLEVCETSRGYVVNPGRVQALAKAILRALENPKLAQMGENGYNLAKRYSWKKVATTTLKLYQHILNYVPVTNHKALITNHKSLITNH